MKSKQEESLELFLSSVKHKLNYATEQASLIQIFKNVVDRNNKKKILEAIELDAHALRMASDSLCNDREVVMASIRKKGLSLIWASRALREDKQLMLEAIKNNAFCIRLGSKALQNDLKFICEAYHLNSDVIKYIDRELIKQNKDLQQLLANYKNKKNIKQSINLT